MKIVAISAFDAPFFEYAKRMYNSLRAFHSGLEMWAGDLGLTNEQVNELCRMGIKVVTSGRTSILKRHGLRLCFGDMLLHSLLQGVDYDAALWIDADTMILRPITAELEAIGNRASCRKWVIGHPGRHAGGAIWNMDSRYAIAPGTTHREAIEEHLLWKPHGKYIATGLWATNDREFLNQLDKAVDLLHGLTDDSPIFSAVAHWFNEYAAPLEMIHLDPATWNFSRQLVDQARYEQNQIVYGDARVPIKPYTVGFSLTDNGRRLGSPAIDQFYREHVLTRLETK